MTTLLTIGSGHGRDPGLDNYAKCRLAWSAWAGMRSLERDDECESTACLMLRGAL